MRMRTTNRLTNENIPKESRNWVGELISPINNFFTEALKILNDGIIFPDNFIGQEHLFEFTYQSDVASLPIGILWTKGAPPRCLQIASSTENNSSVAVIVAWDYTQEKQVRLTQISKIDESHVLSGLVAGSRYKLLARIFA